MSAAVDTFSMTPAREGVNKWAVAVAVSLAALLELIDTSIVNVALSDIQATLGTTLTEVAWVVSGYAIANVIILPLSAWLGDRFGKKTYFLFSLFGFIGASFLCGMATSFTFLVIARVIQGLTGGGLLAKAQAILFETFPPEEQAAAQGLFGIIVIAGPTIGPTLGGYLTTTIGWRWIFFVNVPVGIVAILMVMTFLPKDSEKASDAPIDWAEILLLAIGVGALQGVLEEGQQELWFESKLIWALTVFAVLGLGAFLVRSLSSKTPVVNLRVLRYRSLWAGSAISAVVGAVLYGSLFAIPIFAATVLQYTSEQIGFFLLPAAIASAIAMPLAAKLTQRFDPRKLIVIGGAVLLLGLMMFSKLSPQTSGEALFWPNMVRGFGIVLIFMPLQLATLGSIPKEDVSASTGIFTLMRQLGGSIGVALLTTLLDGRAAFHRAVLVEKLVPDDPRTLERITTLTQGLVARGLHLEDARQRALLLLDRSVDLQAAVMSFGDTFIATAALLLIALPLVFFLKKPAQGASVSVGH